MNRWIGREALATDVTTLLRYGLSGEPDAEGRRALRGPGAIAAADALAAADMSPALLARVAEAVRAAGIETVAALPRPVPDDAQSRLLRAYLAAATGEEPDVVRDNAMAAWLGTVCIHLAIRRT